MRFVILTGLLMLLVATASLAYAPPAVTFQGRLTDAGGSIIADGTYNVTFRVYDQQSGGSPLWGVTRSVTTIGGVFSVILGESNPLNLPFDQLYFVGVQYEAEAEMQPRVPMTATPYALGVSEYAAVTSLNGLTGDINLVAGSNISITPGGGNLVISASGAVADNDWTVVGADMYAAPAGVVGIGTSAPESKLHVVGDVTAGDSSTPGYFYAHTGSGGASYFGGDYLSEGGELSLLQETGIPYMIAQPDFDGEGGFVQIYNGNGSTALRIDGNTGTNDYAVISSNGTSSFAFNMNETGNASIQLPAASLNSLELENETGLASINDHGTSSFALDGSTSVVTSRTITAPTDGFLLAMASMEIELNHQGTSCFATAGLSLTTSLPNNQDLSFYLPSSAGTGLYLTPTTPTAVFPVTAGSHTVNILASRSGTTDAVIWDAQLNVVFIPTSYGTVALAADTDRVDQLSNTAVSVPMTSGDMAAEQRQSQRDNDDRLERELSELRAQLDALQVDIDAQRANGQGSSRR